MPATDSTPSGPCKVFKYSFVSSLISNSIITSELQQEMDQNNDIIVTSRVEGEALLYYSLILINTIDSMTANRKLKHSNSNTYFLKYLIAV